MSNKKHTKMSTKEIIFFTLLTINLILTAIAFVCIIQLKNFKNEVLPVIYGRQELLMSEKIECFDKTKDSFKCDGVKRESNFIKDLEK